MLRRIRWRVKIGTRAGSARRAGANGVLDGALSYKQKSLPRIVQLTVQGQLSYNAIPCLIKYITVSDDPHLANLGIQCLSSFGPSPSIIPPRYGLGKIFTSFRVHRLHPENSSCPLKI